MRRFNAFAVLLLALGLLGSSPAAHAEKGGASSGGGAELGIFAKKALRTVSEEIDAIPGVYTDAQKDLLRARYRAIKSIAIVQKDLPAANPDGHTYGSGGFVQDGTAYSTFDGENAQVELNEARFGKLVHPLAIEGLLHHELAVLAKLERTGEYHYTDAFVKYREKFWEKRLAERTLCTVSLFDREPNFGSEGNHPGRLLGSIATRQTQVGSTTGGWGVLRYLGPPANQALSPAIVARYVIGGEGYLRMSFSRGKADATAFADLEDLTQEITFYNPYEWLAASRESLLKEFDFGFVQVGCSRY